MSALALTAPEHETSEAVSIAANWYRDHRATCPRPVVRTLRSMFPVTPKEACRQSLKRTVWIREARMADPEKQNPAPSSQDGYRVGGLATSQVESAQPNSGLLGRQGDNRLPVLISSIAGAHRAALAAERTSVERAIAAGQALLEAKALVEHGQWLPFLKATGVPERTARNYMTLARSGLGSATVADLGGIRAALEFLTRWQMPEFHRAMLVRDPAKLPGAEGFGRGAALIWEDDKHRGHFNVGMLIDSGDDAEAVISRRPMKPTTSGQPPIDVILGFMDASGFKLPITEWELCSVARREAIKIMMPFWTDNTMREAAVGGAA